jgi:hypothetical protein
MREKKLTLHQEGKLQRNVDKEKYDMIKLSIVECLRRNGELTHTQLNECVKHALEGRFVGSIGWYTETVKLDLEAYSDSNNYLMRTVGVRPCADLDRHTYARC